MMAGRPIGSFPKTAGENSTEEIGAGIPVHRDLEPARPVYFQLPWLRGTFHLLGKSVGDRIQAGGGKTIIRIS